MLIILLYQESWYFEYNIKITKIDNIDFDINNI